MSRRTVSMVALAVALMAAGLFAAVAHLLGRYDAVAIWAGAGWVFLLATIVALPALSERFTRSTGAPRNEGDPGTRTS